MKFSELNLKPEILGALDEMGYTELTPVQEATFPHILGRRDILALAETGSGKTSACGVPLTQMIDEKRNAIQALILVPTRELALQYVSEIAKIASQTEIAPFAMFGGFSMEIQKAKLEHKVQILVATPGRLIDFLYNTPLTLSDVQTVVLDEADQMLNMGFVDDVNFIMSCMIQEHQTLLFAATMSREIDRLAVRYLKDPVRIELNKEQIAPQSLAHHFRHVGRGERLTILEEYIKEEEIAQAIIFCNSRTGGEKLLNQLRDKFDSIDFIHGGLEQARRTMIYNRFKRKEIKLMVATDIASRGLDFSHVSHVINYDFPLYHETYTHRTGRTARMGRTGVALTLVMDRDLRKLGMMLRKNRIEAVWQGHQPEVSLSPRKGRSSGARSFRHRGGGGKKRGQGAPG